MPSCPTTPKQKGALLARSETPSVLAGPPVGPLGLSRAASRYPREGAGAGSGAWQRGRAGPGRAARGYGRSAAAAEASRWRRMGRAQRGASGAAGGRGAARGRRRARPGPYGPGPFSLSPRLPPSPPVPLPPWGRQPRGVRPSPRGWRDGSAFPGTPGGPGDGAVGLSRGGGAAACRPSPSAACEQGPGRGRRGGSSEAGAVAWDRCVRGLPGVNHW